MSERRPVLLDLLSAVAPVSGARLAVQLGISRAAVWKQIEVLRETGLPIEARAGRGYLLGRPQEWLDAARLRRALRPSLRKQIDLLETHWKLDSTSSELARRIDTLPQRAFVFAETQTAGRGRRGRAWRSPPGANLYLSCLQRFGCGYAALSGLSLAVGVAIVHALEDCGVRGVDLKWPNDLVSGQAKLAGILIELGGEFLGPCHAIIGIGVNLHLPHETRAAIAQPVIDLEEICGGQLPPRHKLAGTIIARQCETLDAFADSGFAAVARDFARHDVLRDRMLRVEDPRGAFDGVGAGVDARGALRVRTRNGERIIDSAEVSIRTVHA